MIKKKIEIICLCCIKNKNQKEGGKMLECLINSSLLNDINSS